MQKFFTRLTTRYRAGSIPVSLALLLAAAGVLPLLPDTMLGGVFNPYKTWAMTVVIAAIAFAGFLAVRFFGRRHGVFVTGAAGGLISSTAVSITISRLWRRARQNDARVYAAGIGIACTFMYLRVLLETVIVDPPLAQRLALAFLAAAAMGLGLSLWWYLRSPAPPPALDESGIVHDPLQLSDALKFGILFGIIYGAVAFTKARYGDLGVYVVAFFSGLTDVDAITLSLGQAAHAKTLPQHTAAEGIVIASVTNSLVKLGIVRWIGGGRLARPVAVFFAVTLGALAGFLLLT